MPPPRPADTQFGRPGRDPLVRGQHLVRRELAAHQGGVAGVLGPPLDPGLPGGRLPALPRLLGGDFHDGAGDGGAQPARSQPARPVQDCGLGGAGLSLIQQRGGMGDQLGLVPGDDPVTQRRGGAGQPDRQVPGQVEQRPGRGAGLGQRAGQFVVDELRIGLRHPSWPLGLAVVPGIAPVQLRDSGELAGGHVGFEAVPRGQHSEQLIIGHALVGVIVPGRGVSR